MVLLYLRGQLQPGYPQGVRSVFREEMLLHALALELSADMQRNEMMVQLAFASFFDKARVPKMMRTMAGESRRLGALATLDMFNAESKSNARGSVDSMVKLYQALVKTGFIVENNDA